MSTVTLTYDKEDRFAQSVLEMIRKSGAFSVSNEHDLDTDEWSAEEEREAFLHTSRVNASAMFASYVM